MEKFVGQRYKINYSINRGYIGLIATMIKINDDKKSLYDIEGVGKAYLYDVDYEYDHACGVINVLIPEGYALLVKPEDSFLYYENKLEKEENIYVGENCLYSPSLSGCCDVDEYVYDENLFFFTQNINRVVNKPNHYIGNKGLEVETILKEFMPRYEDSYVAHRVASAIEYLLRSPLKNGKEDIEKARKNLDQALEYLKGE